MNPNRRWGLQWERPLWTRWRRGDFYPQRFLNAVKYYWNAYSNFLDLKKMRGDEVRHP